MYKIFKYPINVKHTFSIDLPKGYEILTLKYKDEEENLWILIDDEQPKEKVNFYIYGTGRVIENIDSKKYIDTFISGFFVWHLFKEI